MSRYSVFVGMPANNPIPVQTVNSLLKTQLDCTGMGIDIGVGFVRDCSVIQSARNEVVHMFLNTPFDFLFWVDSDIVWKPIDFRRILTKSRAYGLVAATYPAKIPGPPQFFIKNEINEDWEREGAGLTDGLIEVNALGLGFCCMPRYMLERIAESSPIEWVSSVNANRAQIFKSNAEDIQFMEDLRELGYKVYLDPDVELGHIGQYMYTGSVKDWLCID